MCLRKCDTKTVECKYTTREINPSYRNFHENRLRLIFAPPLFFQEAGAASVLCVVRTNNKRRLFDSW